MWRIPIIALVFIIIAIACSAPTTGSQPKVSQSSQTARETETKTLTKLAWEAEWDNIVKEARKEGKVVIFTSAGGPTPGAISQGFKRSLGIDAEMTAGTSSNLMPKITSEKRAGLHTVDIYLGGFTEHITVLKAQGLSEVLLPVLILPEVKEEKYWYEGKHRWVDKDKMALSGWVYPSGELLVNKDLVMVNELSSLKELLNPKWKGKIIMYDASIPGAAIAWFLNTEQSVGTDFMKKLALQEPTILRDHRLIVEWLARGKFAIGIGVASEMVDEFIKAGAPLRTIFTPENAYFAGGSGAISLLKNAPHPAAAKVFVNWYLSKEGQLISSRAQGVQSAREDLPTEHLNPGKIRQPDIKYADRLTEEFIPIRVEKMKLFKEIFGHLMR